MVHKMAYRTVTRTTIRPWIVSGGNEIIMDLRGTRMIYDARGQLIQLYGDTRTIATGIAGCKYPIFYDPAIRYYVIVGLIADYMARCQNSGTITLTITRDEDGAPEIDVGAELDDVATVLSDAIRWLASILTGAEIKKIGAKNDKNTEEVIENAEQ